MKKYKIWPLLAGRITVIPLILLLHAVSETNLAILPQLIESARARGYQFNLLTAMQIP